LDIERLGRSLSVLFLKAISFKPDLTLKACGEFALVQLIASRFYTDGLACCEFDWSSIAQAVHGSESEKIAIECLRLQHAPPEGLYYDNSFEGFWLEGTKRTDEDWGKLSLFYLYKAATEGLNDSLVYDLAHIGFYWTNFGMHNLTSTEFAAIGALLIAYLERVSGEDFDLRSEIFLALLSMKLVFGNRAVEDKLNAFREEISEYFCMNGFLIAHKQIDKNSDIYWYSCFHTSSVVFILLLMLEKRAKSLL
jgi:hypothetical protein